MRVMRELDVRRSLTSELEAAHASDPRTIIRDELPVCSGRRRVDVAVINGELTGYEIKSDVDKLVRLAGQSEMYGRVFDRMWLVVGHRHCAEAVAAVPCWWGVMLAAPASDGQVAVIEQRTAQVNDGEQDGAVIAPMLWRDEALALLDEFDLGDAKLRRGSKRHMHTVLAAGATAPPAERPRTRQSEVKGLAVLVCCPVEAQHNC